MDAALVAMGLIQAGDRLTVVQLLKQAGVADIGQALVFLVAQSRVQGHELVRKGLGKAGQGTAAQAPALMLEMSRPVADSFDDDFRQMISQRKGRRSDILVRGHCFAVMLVGRRKSVVKATGRGHPVCVGMLDGRAVGRPGAVIDVCHF